MKIAISATGTNLEASVDQRFGRCKYFLIIDLDTMDHQAIDNQGAMAAGGAGIKAAQSLSKIGVKAAISGNIGPNAFNTLSAANIDTYVGISGKIKDVVDKFKLGELKKTESSNVSSHFGTR